MAVFVLDRRGEPLMPCSEKRAKQLHALGRARVHRLVPFAIRIVDRLAADSVFQELELKTDPGSKTTGLALVRTSERMDGTTGEITKDVVVLNLFELIHRGRQISENLTRRAGFRGRRRSKLWYRRPGWNDNKRDGWLPPSLRHRVETTMAWVERLRKLAPITGLAMELVRFDLQALENPKIQGIEYQQGTLAGTEVREYLLAKWGRTCAYCDAEGVPLNVDHVHAKACGGTDRVSNLTIACIPCNQEKDARDVREFLAHDPERLAKILAQLKRPLKDAAAVNSTRLALRDALMATGLPVETASGGLTKFNRTKLGVPKTHALDAVCVGRVDTVRNWRVPTLAIKCTGRGSYRRTRSDAFGFPRGYLMREKSAKGFRTGDLVRADVPKGKHQGTWTGRVAIRRTGRFNLQTGADTLQSISYKYCRLLQRADGYGYAQLLPPQP